MRKPKPKQAVSVDDHLEEVLTTGQTQPCEVEDDAELLDELCGTITHIGRDAQACTEGPHQDTHDDRSPSEPELDRHAQSRDS